MEAEYPFGTARKWGAVGFALGIGVAGAVADPFGLQSVFPMFAIFFLLTALLIWISLKGKKGIVSMDDPPHYIRNIRTARKDSENENKRRL